MELGSPADPYVTLTYSRLGKALFSTRIIKSDRNPVFEETAALLVDLSVLKLGEKLSIQLWDSDRSSAVGCSWSYISVRSKLTFSQDDMLGFVEVDIIGIYLSLLLCLVFLTGHF